MCLWPGKRFSLSPQTSGDHAVFAQCRLSLSGAKLLSGAQTLQGHPTPSDMGALPCSLVGTKALLSGPPSGSDPSHDGHRNHVPLHFDRMREAEAGTHSFSHVFLGTTQLKFTCRSCGMRALSQASKSLQKCLLPPPAAAPPGCVLGSVSIVLVII